MPSDLKRIWDACGEAFDRFTSAGDSYSENIERPAVERLLGDLSRQRVLDLGCGSGPFSTLFAQRGAQVIGLDLSEKMISLAREKTQARGLNAEFRVADITQPLAIADSEFDLVFSGTALHYVQHLPAVMMEVARVLKPGGRFIASVLHPFSTARFPVADADEPVDVEEWHTRYFGQRSRSIGTPWVGFGEVEAEGRRLFCYHHTLSDYVGALAAASLELGVLCEPEPPREYAEKNAGRFDEAMRTPIYLIFQATKRS